MSNFRAKWQTIFRKLKYIHYPKVAIGHWPPFFYVIQAGWMLLFSFSRISVILFMASLTTLLAGSIYVEIRQEFNDLIAIAMAFLLISLPLIQKYSGMVMAEILVALLSFWAVYCFGRFLDTEKRRSAIGFAIFAALAILTKGNGLALALVPLFALLFSRRFYLLTQPNFYYPAIIVLVLCGPWYIITLDMVKNGMQSESFSLSFVTASVPYYSYSIIKITGVVLSCLTLLGFITKVIIPCRYKNVEGRWVAFSALLLSVWTFHLIVPAGLESRHLITCVPILLMFLAAGIHAALNALPNKIRFSKKIDLYLTYGRKFAIFIFVLLFIFKWETFTIPGKECYGFGNVARKLLSTSRFQQSVILISSDSNGEGMFISEFAMREQRPGHIIFRASKVLARSKWSGRQYELFYNTPEAIMNYLDGVPVGIVIIDKSISVDNQRKRHHHRLLNQTIDMYAQKWERLGFFPVTRKGLLYPDAIEVYSLKGHEGRDVKTIEIDMSNMLDRSIKRIF